MELLLSLDLSTASWVHTVQKQQESGSADDIFLPSVTGRDTEFRTMVILPSSNYIRVEEVAFSAFRCLNSSDDPQDPTGTSTVQLGFFMTREETDYAHLMHKVQKVGPDASIFVQQQVSSRPIV